MYEKISPIIVAGAGGYMGVPYVRKLIECGIPLDQIIGVEPNAERAEAITNLGVSVRPSVLDCKDIGPKTAIVVVPSPLHRKVFDQCAEIGVQNLFTEKPLVLRAEELEGLDTLEMNILVGYLINFSPIVEKLIMFMREHHLRCTQFMSLWGKNWCAVNRPMGPDLEEELPHPLVLALALIGYDFESIRAYALAGSFIPFVRPELVQEADEQGFGFGRELNDTSIAFLKVQRGSYPSVPVSILSSFNAFEQRRLVDVSLSTFDKSFPDYKVCLEFDNPAQGGTVDRLRIIGARDDNLVLEKEWLQTGKPDKIGLQLKAVLEAFAGGSRHPMIVDFDTASQVVRLLDKAL